MGGGSSDPIIINVPLTLNKDHEEKWIKGICTFPAWGFDIVSLSFSPQRDTDIHSERYRSRGRPGTIRSDFWKGLQRVFYGGPQIRKRDSDSRARQRGEPVNETLVLKKPAVMSPLWLKVTFTFALQKQGEISVIVSITDGRNKVSFYCLSDIFLFIYFILINSLH